MNVQEEMKRGYKQAVRRNMLREKMEMEKGYEIIWTDGYKIRVRILNEYGTNQLESDGYWFDDFYGDGTERWTR